MGKIPQFTRVICTFSFYPGKWLTYLRIFTDQEESFITPPAATYPSSVYMTSLWPGAGANTGSENRTLRQLLSTQRILHGMGSPWDRILPNKRRPSFIYSGASILTDPAVTSVRNASALEATSTVLVSGIIDITKRGCFDAIPSLFLCPRVYSLMPL